MTERDVTLPDGRTAALLDCGDPGGRPVFYLHGAGACRLDAEPFDAAAQKRGVRILSLDRPGVGRSSELPAAHSYLGYAGDIAAIADALGIARFAVAGQSNGGVFALAAAYSLGDRVTRVLPINPTTPVADPAVHSALPLTTRLSYAVMRLMVRLGRTARPGVRTGISARLDADRELMESPVGRDWLAKVGGEPMTQRYLLTEMRIAVSPWGFDHRAITRPVDFFTGDRDAGCAYARLWVPELPDARLHVFRGGHSGHIHPDVVTQITDVLAAE